MEDTNSTYKKYLEFLSKIHIDNLETERINKETSEELIEELEWDKRDIDEVETEDKHYEMLDPDLLPDI